MIIEKMIFENHNTSNLNELKVYKDVLDEEFHSKELTNSERYALLSRANSRPQR